MDVPRWVWSCKHVWVQRDNGAHQPCGAVLRDWREAASCRAHPRPPAALPCPHAPQVFPVVSRLCAPIDGTDAGRLADCLGLDGSRYRQAAAAGESREDALLAAAASLDDEDRWVLRSLLHWNSDARVTARLLVEVTA